MHKCKGGKRGGGRCGKGGIKMDISKLGALWSLMTGGWAGLAAYILEAINKWLSGLDVERLARAAAVVKAVANALEILLNTFLSAKYRDAATKTLKALNALAESLADGKVTQDELDANIDAIEDAVVTWKEVK